MNKKLIINVIFWLFMMILLYLSIIFNHDYNAIYNRRIIKDTASLNKYTNYKYITIDTTDINETRFSLKNDDKNSIIYTKNIGKETLLIELTDSTVITNRIDVVKMKDTSYISMLKKNIENEDKTVTDFKMGYYTNVNYGMNYKFLSIKFYVTIGLSMICLIAVIINFISIFIKKKKSEEIY